MYIDTHCHLNFEAFDGNVPDVIKRAEEKDIRQFIIPGTNIASSKKAVTIASEHPSCFAAIGIHPHHAKDSELIVDEILKKQLLELGRKEKIVAVGEIGMDYFVYSKSKYPENTITPELKQKQKELFHLQLEVAQECNLPVIFHCREAFSDMIPLIEEFISKNNWQPRGVFHCFGGGKKDLQTVLDMGFFVGIDGNITYNQNLQFVAEKTPLERLLLETDAPFLAPIPHKGEQNEPKNIPLIASYIAAIQDISPEELADRTTQNARALFGLP